MRDPNRVTDEGAGHDQNIEEQRDRDDGGGSQTVSRESTGGAGKVGTGNGDKSGGSGKKPETTSRRIQAQESELDSSQQAAVLILAPVF